MQRLVYELRVHQIELEMQNEELRHAQRELEVAREKYFDLYDFAPVGYLTLNVPGRILEANLTAARLLGVARTDLVRQPLTRFILREDLGIFHQHRQRLFETRAPQSCELRLTRPGGAPLWVRGEAILVQDHKTGAPVCRMTLCDITERKQAEADRERLAQSERLAQLMKCANDSILLADEHGRILEANDRALETYGYSLAELRQKTIEDLRTPKSRAELPHQLDQLETDGRSVFETMNQRRDEAAFPVEISARFIEIAGVRHRMGIVRDITRRKRAEAALQETNEYLENLFNHANAPIIVWNPQFHIMRFNHAFESLTGRKAGDVVGGSLEVLFPPGLVASSMELIKKTLGGERWETVEIPILHLDGSVRTVLWNSATIFADDRKTPVAAIAQGQDITERKQAEEELKLRNEELIRFTYTVSHDLKSPVVTLRTFLGYLEQDSRNQDAARVAKDLDYMRTAAEKMSRLLDELLELSRVGHKVNPPVEAPLQAIVDEALALVAGRIAQRGVQVRVTEEPIRLYGDHPRLVQVFQNLVDNAVKFMGDQPAPRVEIGVEQARDELVLFVRDNGIGIDPRHQPKLFGLFEKLDPGTEGTGIGLALVRRIVEVHGGRIWVESAGPGQGATFRFTLAKMTQRRPN